MKVWEVKALRREYIDIITEQIRMEDILNQYGFTPNKAGFICCPFHSEKTPSLKPYQGGRKWKCFGCGEGGSVIDFVMKLYEVGLNEAITKINYDFALGLPLGQRLSIRQQQEIKKKEREQKKRQEMEQAAAEEKERNYWAVWEEWIRLDQNRMNYAPKTEEEEWHPLYVEALRKLPYQEYLIDCLD